MEAVVAEGRWGGGGARVVEERLEELAVKVEGGREGGREGGGREGGRGEGGREGGMVEENKGE